MAKGALYWNSNILRLILLFAASFAFSLGPAVAQDRAVIEQQFQTWLEGVVWDKAKAEGVSQDTFRRAFAEVTLNWDLSGLVFPGMEPDTPQEQNQAEFRAPAKYFDNTRLDATASIGRRLAAQHANTLATVEATSGVPARIVMAIWARESGYGRVPIPHNTFHILGSRAYASTGEYLTNELIAALKIVDTGHIPIKEMKSSWAGALGQPQFMPASYLAYAADGDGDGRADIWKSAADTMASIANFLAVHGWAAGRDWGFEVSVPASISCALEGPDNARKIEDWDAMGIKRISGNRFPLHELQGEGSLLMPAGRHGPAFIVTPNFYVLKRYNRSDLYALYVGNLGDRIEYSIGGFKAGWKTMQTTYRSNIGAIQRQLEALGHDVGGADGLVGFKTRRAIGEWQAANKHQPTCFPAPGMQELFTE